MSEPLHQFEIHKYIPLSFEGIDLSFTNASLFMLIAVGVITVFLGGGPGAFKNHPRDVAIPGRDDLRFCFSYLR
jgi:hypothetical protein